MSIIYSLFGSSHSSSASLLKDGEIISCVEEERLTRIKAADNDPSYPDLSLLEIEKNSKIKLNDSDHIVFVEPVSLKYINKITKKNFDVVSHHDAHCYGSYYTSGMNGKVLTISYDGGGEKSVMKIYLCEDGKMKLYRAFDLCSFGSISHVWGFVTSGFLGPTNSPWRMLKDEGKLMGMAPNGHYDEKIYRMLNSVIKYKDLRFYPSNTGNKTRFLIDSIYNNGYLDTKQKKEIFCYNLQKLTEDLFLNFLDDLHKILPEYKKICFSGGLFANVKLNQKINELDWVDEIYVYPPMGDEGLSLGGAIYKAVQLGEWTKPKKIKNVYFGTKYTNEEIYQFSRHYNFTREEYSSKKIAQDLNKGKIVGWFKDGFEYGPRALGARSILVRPTDIETHKVLNKRLKRHDTMPFAPIIMSEYFDDVFTSKKSKYSAEFMTICYSTKDEWIDRIPAVIQKSDKTARPQIVNKKNLPKFWEILNEYYSLSGIPLLLNTSFNSHNQPIINSPDLAFEALNNEIIDKLVIEDYVYFRR